MKVSELKHGAIYELSSGLLARCNVCVDGNEVWMTNKEGREVGHPNRIKRWVSNRDDSFKNNDVINLD